MSTFMGTAPQTSPSNWPLKLAPQTKPSKTQTLNKFGDPFLCLHPSMPHNSVFTLDERLQLAPETLQVSAGFPFRSLHHEYYIF